MFKHLSKLASANQARLALQSTNKVAVQTFQTSNKTFGQQLFRNGGMKNSLTLLNFQRQIISRAAFSTAAAKRVNIDSLIPDYQIDENDHFDHSKIVLTHEEVQQKHPAEYATQYMRDHLDYSKLVNSNEFLLFNLPNSITHQAVLDLCQHKGVQVLKAKLQMSLDDARPAFAWVQLGSPQQVKTLKDKFRNLWLEDRKVKLKAKEDIGYEIFDHRTVIVRGIPEHYQRKEIVSLFSNFGSLVSIELPLKNLAIEQELRSKVDQYQKEKQEQRLTEVRRAQKIVSDSIQENAQYYREVVSKYMGAEEANQFMKDLNEQFLNQDGSKRVDSLLNEKRHIAIQSMISQLQSESAQVSKAKKTLLKLRGYTEDKPAIEGPSKTDLNSQILQNKDLLKNTISYLRQNRDAIDEKSLAKLNTALALDSTGEATDPIDRLLSLQRAELSTAYDVLLSCLEQREGVIEKRIKQQVDHLGKEERIMFEEKDWSRELEDIKSFEDPFSSTYKAEEILSVTEQVHNVQSFKNMDPRERLYRMMTKTYNPFLDPNFNENQMANTTSHQMQEEMIPREPADPNLPPSVNRDNFAGYVFLQDSLEELQEKVQSLRDHFDMPFDELYHKEKRLVDSVIKATEALKAKENSLPDPMGAERMFSPEELNGKYLSSDYSSEHQFIKDQRRRNEKILNESIDNDNGSTAFSYKLDDMSNKIEELLATNMISKKEYNLLKTMEREAQEVNLGYAFVTFSHTDEAKLALIMAQGMFLSTNLTLDLSIKHKDIDHGDFDKRYSMNRQRNQGKLVNELQRLRESRQDLREFEQNMDKDLPSLKKIKDFRDLAREVIDDPSRPKVGALLDKRTTQEERDLDDKIRKMQRENPDLDLTQLFETERAEIARKAQHKKAFASYKAFQFLKHGVEIKSRGVVETAKAETQSQPAPFKSADPYDFPPLQQAVDRVMKTKERLPRVLDAGEALTDKPGRKFGYTEQDFMEAYFGKDNARQARLTIDDEASVFGFNDSYKKKYPIDKYQKLPKLEAEQRFMAARSDIHGFPGDSKDQGIYNLIENLDIDQENYLQDKQHPTDKNRSFMKDQHQKVEAYMKNKEKRTGIEGLFNTREVGGIVKSVRDEYYPKPKKEEKKATDELEDVKQDEKFEPFYEGDNGSKSQTIEDVVPESSADSSSTIPDPSAITGEKPQKSKRFNKRDDGVTAAGANAPAREHRSKKLEDAEWMKSPLYTGVSPQQEYQFEPLNSEDRDQNREFVYDHNYRKEHSTYDQDSETLLMKRLQKVAHVNNMTDTEFFEKVKDQVYIQDDQTRGSGRYANKSKLGTGKTESDAGQGRSKKARSIQEFAGATGTNDDLSEREDEDIYNHYMNEMRRAKLEEAQEKIKDKDLSKHERLAQEKIKEIENLYPDMPRFEGFFKSQSEGKHPFEESEFRDSNEKASDEQIKAEEEFDEKLFERELEGRLIGDTLTPRQFEIMYKARLEDDGKKIRFMKDQNKNEFIDQRDIVRIMDEQRESCRRHNVISGKWKEEESEQKMKELDLEAAKNAPVYDNDITDKADFMEIINFFKNIHSPSTLFDKEYYFDEGLGESLQEHVDDIKSRFPQINVQVRRDRDGYAIIKTQYKPTYKYNLEDIEKFNADQTMETMKESLDDILKTVLGQDSILKLDKQQLESKLQMLMNNKDHSKNYDLDDSTKQAVAQLWKERTQGKFKNDREGFTKAFMALSEKAKFDQDKELPNSFFSNDDHASMDNVYNDIVEERHLMTSELTEQLTMRVREHIFLKERKLTDFARARRSEQSVFERQVSSHENRARTLEEKAAQIVQGKKEQEEGFDKEAYQAIKEEIKKRREAKERLLQQGFPELKSYVNI